MPRKMRPIAASDRVLSAEVLAKMLDGTAPAPLDVMQGTMQMLYDGARSALRQYEAASGVEREYLMDVARKHALDACALAKEIAPYVHRKQPIALETKDMTDDDKRRNAETIREVEKILSDQQRTKRSRLSPEKHRVVN